MHDRSQKIGLNKRTEGDINFSPARDKWLNEEVPPASRELLEKDARFFLHQSLSTPCLDVLKDCEGPSIESLSGKKYLDFHGNNVHQIGFSHPKLVERLTGQLQSLTFSTRRYTNENAIQFAEKLASLLPSDLNRTLMTPNGSSAIGIALKLARAVTGKFKVVSFWDSFHGASLDAISVGGEAVFREYMGPLMPGVERIPPPVSYRGIFEGDEGKCLEHLEYVFAKEGDIGAFLAETIRNTDVQIPSKNFWQEARALCDKYGVLLILDEIPIALGRTGKMFAFEHFDIEPDILCLGKGLGGGIFPQAAMVTRDAYNRFGDISLGHYTHEKSPMGALAALTTIEIIEEEKLVEKSIEDAQFMKAELGRLQDRYDIIGDVRGAGLLWGLELVKDRRSKEKAILEAEKVMYHCLREGLSFKVSAGNVLQLAPALTVTRNELHRALTIIENAINQL
ncbi:(R)-1-hydroxy-2-aminoethylphosphonate ammonia-lyase [Pseudozobellia thermophila]|uniref:4-aminobutyrate aminotransferase apoenzyme n=1 Tax=Pseudozobellia thermophila TaxID=192903 RepID=A0A1M6B5L2_9FLAO|nr:aspartate aminotransferase family protein [Pseudozobellia thermophila]SHI44021.1 4-aminobutyrate aminotransferase apoenzyme [Pseudozobellia thermophila]